MEHESYHEIMQRGRFDFPIGFYHVEKYHPRFNMPYHWHMEYELIHILHGGFTISLNDETIHMVPGDIVFVSDGIVHGGVVDSDDTVYECLVFDPQKLLLPANYHAANLDQIFSHTLRVRNHFTPDDQKLSAVIPALFNQFQQHQPGYELIVIGLLYTVFGLIIQEKQYTTVAVEPVTYHSMNSAAATRHILDTMRSPNLKVIFDMSNLVDAGNVGAQDRIWNDVGELLGDQIVAVHFKGQAFAPDGGLLHTSLEDSLTDYAGAFAMLRQLPQDALPVLREEAVPSRAASDIAFMRGFFA